MVKLYHVNSPVSTQKQTDFSVCAEYKNGILIFLWK